VVAKLVMAVVVEQEKLSVFAFVIGSMEVSVKINRSEMVLEGISQELLVLLEAI